MSKRIEVFIQKWGAILFFFLSFLMLFRTSNLEWHKANNYWVLFNQYSSEYFFFVLCIFFIACSLALHGFCKRSSFQKLRYTVFSWTLIFLYTTSGTLCLTEYILHKMPEWVPDNTLIQTPHEVHLNLAKQFGHEDVGFLAPPNVFTKEGQSPFDVQYRYPDSELSKLTPPLVKYVSDSRGFRNPPELEQADLVVLGDSFTHGPHVEREQIWSSLLAKRFGVSYANLALAGYCPPQQKLVLELLGMQYLPKFVILQLYSGNDLYESARFQRWKNSGISYVEYTQAEITDLPDRFITWDVLKKILPNWFDQNQNQPIEIVVNEKSLKMGFHQELDRLQYTESDIILHEGWEPLTQAILEMKDICDRHSIHFSVMLVPSKLSIYLDCIRDDGERFKLVTQQFQSKSEISYQEVYRQALNKRNSFQKSLQSFFKSNNISYIDLTPHFRCVDSSIDDKSLLYFPADSHWTTDGHVLAAEIFYRESLLDSVFPK